jgi:hypothetical protein
MHFTSRRHSLRMQIQEKILVAQMQVSMKSGGGIQSCVCARTGSDQGPSDSLNVHADERDAFICSVCQVFLIRRRATLLY